MSLNEGLYSSKYILKKYRKEVALRELSKKNLEKVIDTLDKELQFQNSHNSGFFAFLGLVLVLILFIAPMMINNDFGGVFTIIDDRKYKLESIDLKMIGEEYNLYPEGVTGTYKIDKGFEAIENNMALVRIGTFFYILICLYYYSSLLHTKKIYKIYKRARYICSLK